MLIKDEHYARACQDAKDDYFIFGINRTDEDVNEQAERYRQQDKRNVAPETQTTK